jgi:hypothetical protein
MHRPRHEGGKEGFDIGPLHTNLLANKNEINLKMVDLLGVLAKI